MIIPVHMLAFYKDKKIVRHVNIPDDEYAYADGIEEQVLDLVFKYGQNDFQQQKIYSVSVGDVIEMNNKFFMIMVTGFEELTKEQFENLKPPTSSMGYSFKNISK